MIDIKFLRENPDVVRENIKKKFQAAQKFPKPPGMETGTASHFQQIKCKTEVVFENKCQFKLHSL